MSSEYASQIQAHKARRQRFEMAAQQYSNKSVAEADAEQAAVLEGYIPPKTLPPIPNTAIRIACQIAFPPAEPAPLIPERLTVDLIQRAVCRHYKVSKRDLVSARRTGDIIIPRQVGYYLAKKLTERSLPDIAARFGGRDHTSALSGIRKIERLRASDAKLDADLHEIAASVGGSLG